ncbi:mitochondrial 54S ribosomal protein mL40 Ecym_1406 [Eremothecium cymbalariae DBVPG|uniref:Large ribosomal subunit protein mL40 n=1 Tax=Eremothecium cymbalariae (strain CBS 270.75 / DBVPG 7215 / KCTC 17166 / NRRL Y-17582) TaxID=931890 RepID=G8JM64_ERECY|nr:hypothetical protein Ecym_1406 [Eremothecium cymbalariae DBVPG\
MRLQGCGLSGGVNGSVLSSPTRVFVRGKRTKSKSSLSPQVQRAVTQLSVLSASRKQPKLLKLCNEDLIKHQTIQTCWSQYQKNLREERQAQMRLQYESMQTAMNLLKQVDGSLFEAANAKEVGKRFPLELRVPTEYPPNKIWHYEFKDKN